MGGLECRDWKERDGKKTRARVLGEISKIKSFSFFFGIERTAGVREGYEKEGKKEDTDGQG